MQTLLPGLAIMRLTKSTPFLQVNEGSALASGALIATLDLDDPTKVKRAETFTGEQRTYAR